MKVIVNYPVLSKIIIKFDYASIKITNNLFRQKFIEDYYVDSILFHRILEYIENFSFTSSIDWNLLWLFHHWSRFLTLFLHIGIYLKITTNFVSLILYHDNREWLMQVVRSKKREKMNEIKVMCIQVLFYTNWTKKIQTKSILIAVRSWKRMDFINRA